MTHVGFDFNITTLKDIDYRLEWEKAKEHLAHTATIYFPRRELEWILRTDASTSGFGGVLLQMTPNINT